mgnify:CR=1 FL=1
MSSKNLFGKRDIIFRIFDGPDKKDLWMRSPQIDGFRAVKEITQLPVLFLCEVGLQKAKFHVYLESLFRMENDENSVLFRGTSIDEITGESVLVEGQYDFSARSGFMEIKGPLT